MKNKAFARSRLERTFRWLARVGRGPTACVVALSILVTSCTQQAGNPAGSGDVTPEIDAAGPVASGGSGWRVRTYQEVDGRRSDLGEGTVRYDEASGTVLAMDMVFRQEDANGRMVVNDNGAFFGASRGSRGTVWIDLSEPAGKLPFINEIRFAPAGERGKQSVRRDSIDGQEFEVFETPGETVTSGDVAIRSWQETWVNAQERTQRLVQYTEFGRGGDAELRTVSVMDRDDQVVVMPPSVSRGNAVPVAAMLRRLNSMVERAKAARMEIMPRLIQARSEHVDTAMSMVNAAPRDDRTRFPNDSKARFLLIQGKESVRDKMSTRDELLVELAKFGAITAMIGSGIVGWLKTEAPKGVPVALMRAGGLFTVFLGFAMLGVFLAPHILSYLHGEPHIRTFDGQGYGFQAIGEFVHVSSSGFGVQLRFEGEKGKMTQTKATAVRAGEHVVESYYARRAQRPQEFAVIIDGIEKTLGYEGISFEDGTFVARRHGLRGGLDDNVLIVAPNGSYALVENLLISQNVVVSVIQELDFRGGIGGSPDRNPSNDFTLRDGTILPLSSIESIEGLYGRFASSWRVRPEERLFTRGKASDFLSEEYTSVPRKVTRLADFSKEQIVEARGLCLSRGVAPETMVQDCAYDVLVSGDPAWANQANVTRVAEVMDEDIPPVIRAEVEIVVPKSVPAGATFRFDWRGPRAPGDSLFILKAGAKASMYQTRESARHDAGSGSPGELTALAVPGEYEIRYFSYANGVDLLRVPILVTEPEIRLQVPQRVAAGSALEARWEGPGAKDDVVFIAPTGTGDNMYPLNNKHEVAKGAVARLVAPVKVGSYELRYFSSINAAVLARMPFAVTEPDVSLNAPRQVSPGAVVPVTWKGPNAEGDLIFLFPPDVEENKYPLSNHHKTKDGPNAKLIAPAKPGTYEIRYFSFANGGVLARRELIVR